jgi:hypothetical protein
VVAPRLTIVFDGVGGHLRLPIGAQDVFAFIFVCRCILNGVLPPGASLFEVQVGDQTYLVSQPPEEEGACLRVVNLHNPAEHIDLARKTASIVLALLEEGMDAQ